jgi:hypothetical protein
MTLRLLIAAAVSALAVGTASAQYPAYGYSFTNPYTGYSTVSSYGYNPYTGTLGGYTANFNPLTGYGMRNYGYQNVLGGYARGYSAFNAYNGAYYGNRVGYNPWFNTGYNFYRVRPGFGYYGW